VTGRSVGTAEVNTKRRQTLDRTVGDPSARLGIDMDGESANERLGARHSSSAAVAVRDARATGNDDDAAGDEVVPSSRRVPGGWV